MAILEQMIPGSAQENLPARSSLEAARQRLIVALDVPDAAAAARLVDKLEGHCSWFKVGMELFTAAGPAVLEPILRRGHRVFLDLKFHDIPNTVSGAVRAAAALGAHMTTLHAGGGPAMLAAARSALDGVANPPELLAVTVLTSMDSAQLNAVGVESPPLEQAQTLASMALAVGFRGFVCSPKEVATLRVMTGPAGILVVPGIRPAGAESADQKRVASPAEALQQGASYVVVGRPITQAADPATAAEAILREMADCLSG